MDRNTQLNYQISMQEELQEKGFNIIYCCNCGTTLIHKKVHLSLNCWNCLHKVYMEDCEDFYYNGMTIMEENG